MLNELPLILLKYYIITVILEIFLAYLLKIRKKKDILNIILVNLITNPPFSLAIFLINMFWGIEAYYACLIILEITIILIEGRIYKKILSHQKINIYVLSLLLNLSSYLGGILINIYL